MSEEKKKDKVTTLTIRVEPEKAKLLKKYVIDEDTSIQKLFNDYIDEILKKYEKK